MAEIIKNAKVEATVKNRKTLAELFAEPCAVAVASTQMHQGFQLPGAGTESSLHCGRPQLRDLKLVYHPGYGLIGCNKGKYFLSPSPNVILAKEE